MTQALTSVSDARRLAKEKGYRAIMIVGIRDDGQVDIATYGRSKADCKVIGDYGQKQWGDHFPQVPFTSWFGVGNGGIPKAISAADLAELPERQRAYVAANTHPKAVPADVKDNR